MISFGDYSLSTGDSSKPNREAIYWVRWQTIATGSFCSFNCTTHNSTARARHAKVKAKNLKTTENACLGLSKTSIFSREEDICDQMERVNMRSKRANNRESLIGFQNMQELESQ